MRSVLDQYATNMRRVVNDDEVGENVYGGYMMASGGGSGNNMVMSNGNNLNTPHFAETQHGNNGL